MLDNLYALSKIELIALLLAGFLGLVAHFLGKLIELRRENSTVTWHSYYVQHAPETALSVITVLAGTYGLIEANQATVFSVFLLGHFVDSTANKFRSRAISSS
jgi:hypothetical protein